MSVLCSKCKKPSGFIGFISSEGITGKLPDGMNIICDDCEEKENDKSKE